MSQEERVSQNTKLSVTGYVGEWSVAPGDKISLHVSCTEPEYEVAVEKLRHGDLNPAGPGFRSEPVPTAIDGVRPGRIQRLCVGSCVVGPADLPLPSPRLTLGLWVWPTAPASGAEQVLAGWRNGSADDGFAMVLADDGEVCVRYGPGSEASRLFQSTMRLRRRSWFYIAATLDGESLTLHVRPRDEVPGDPARGSIDGHIGRTATDARFVVGACPGDGCFESHFNGKVERPTVWSEALTASDIETVMEGNPRESEILSWDFSRDQGGTQAVDVSPNGRHGTIRNAPMRAVTGWRWDGSSLRFSDAPEHYGALWLHDDDLDDAGWEADLELQIPDDWQSGIYAFQLVTESEEPNDDYVPFIVRPNQPRPEAVALLVPTLTYLAYANEHIWSRPQRLARLGVTLDEFLHRATDYEKAVFSYILYNRQHSIYDDHSDGSGVAYSSRRRPVVNFRPRYNKPALGFKHPHGLSCDLYIVDWLTELGYDFVCITDEDLHREGAAILDGYRAVMTGSHPEYWTSHMLDSLNAWLDDGGRLMYLGGNGFYWATSINPDRPWLLEQRRGENGSRPWTSEPGELFHSTTGEAGGLWRSLGRPPQARLGVGFTAQCGDDRAQPYRRSNQSYDSRVDFIFEGVDDGLIGDFGLHMGGAAGWELDRADTDLGTPPHALVLASSFGHSDGYHHAIEEEPSTGLPTGGKSNPLVRADLTYFEGPKGGAVFSTGSISWTGSLSHNGYSNSVSRITSNVLTRFLDPEPIPEPPREAFS